MKVFEPYSIKNMTLKNRIVMSPMCMYQVEKNGFANDFHFTHYTSRAIGGVGLIIFEATGVNPEGRISDHDLGLWEDGHIEKLKEISDSCKVYGAKTAIQLSHAGRKCRADVPEIFAPSSIPFNEESRYPKELTTIQIKEIVKCFQEAARRADEAGFDAVEIHGAHGYLVHEFLSPITNLRKDEYGGDVAGRTRFLKEILTAVHAVWPKEKPVLLRVSASDYHQDGIDQEEMVEIIDEVKDLIDMLDVSTGGLLPKGVKSHPGYQVPFSEGIRNKCQVPTITVGRITDSNMVEEILNNERADLVALGRELLRNPYWVLYEANKVDPESNIPVSYKRGFL